MPGLMDNYLARMAGGPQKQARKLSFGTASGGDGMKRPLTYPLMQAVLGERQRPRPNTAPSGAKPSTGSGGFVQKTLMSALTKTK